MNYNQKLNRSPYKRDLRDRDDDDEVIRLSRENLHNRRHNRSREKDFRDLVRDDDMKGYAHMNHLMPVG